MSGHTNDRWDEYARQVLAGSEDFGAMPRSEQDNAVLEIAERARNRYADLVADGENPDQAKETALAEMQEAMTGELP